MKSPRNVALSMLLLSIGLLPTAGEILGEAGEKPDVTYATVLGKAEVDKIVASVIKQFAEETPKCESVAAPSVIKEPMLYRLQTQSRKVSIDPEFSREVAKLVYDLRTSLEKEAAEKKLRERLRVFLNSYCEFMEGVSTQAAAWNTEQRLNEYLEIMKRQSRCGEIPCSQPPCCRDCDPPPCK